ncbi:hypothetical protein CR513_40804, partial [Mucuna pruriens]
MKDLGGLKCFLSVEVAKSLIGISLYQRKYTLNMITQIGPLEQNHHLVLAIGEVLTEPENCLMYLCFTRLELSYNAHICSQFVQQPKQEYWEATLCLAKWCDLDWISCPLTNIHSQDGSFFLLFFTLLNIMYFTKDQHIRVDSHFIHDKLLKDNIHPTDIPTTTHMYLLVHICTYYYTID